MTCLRSHGSFVSMSSWRQSLFSYWEEQRLKGAGPESAPTSVFWDQTSPSLMTSTVPSTSHLLPLSLWKALLSDWGQKKNVQSIYLLSARCCLFNSFINFQLTFDYENYPTPWFNNYQNSATFDSFISISVSINVSIYHLPEFLKFSRGHLEISLLNISPCIS